MSFPGYLKSLSLVNKNSHGHEPPGQSQEEGEIIPHVRTSFSALRGNETKARDEARSSLQTENIIDERGNTPSKSLWVGNIPPRTTSSELRALFNKFGVIASTKPMAKYAFVNFEHIESAIAAFKEYHDQDIFDTGCSTINIRFTGSQADAKQAKDDTWDRKNSMSTKAQAAQKQFFHPIEPAAESVPDSPPVHWPNGKPPTGPKSQRQDVPQPLRKGDCYRPGDLSRGNSYRSDSDYRRAELEEYSRGRNLSRWSDQHYSPMYSPSRSRSSTGSRYSYTSAKGYRRQEQESPLPWEREGSKIGLGKANQTEVSRQLRAGDDNLFQLNIGTTDEDGLKEGQIKELDARSANKSPREASPQKTYSRMFRSELTSYTASVNDSSDLLTYPRLELSEATLNLLEPASEPKQLSKSPSLHPIERLRLSGDHFRGSSVPSEVPTSSTGTSTKRKRCHDCKRPANDLSPLVQCSKCSKRFHSGCGDPKPSSYPDRSKFACGRCERKQDSGTSFLNAASRLKPQTKSDGKAYLVSPPLSLSYDGNGSTDLSPRNDQPQESENSSSITSFFPNRTEGNQVRMIQTPTHEPRVLQDNTNGIASVMPQPANQQAQQPVSATVVALKPINEGLLRSKYKGVTCKWWLSGKCAQTEDGCYYAHSHTAISFPDRKRVNKFWTCYDWLNERCAVPEQRCLHTHRDTGLHIWKDGRPSFKHVTCFWWSKGKCKWNEDSCKFAHRDTGLYSLDPSDTWQGGSKFSTVNPREDLVRVSQSHHYTETSVSSVKGSSLLDLPSGDNTQGQPLDSNHQEMMYSQANKPSLTINTCTDLSPKQRHMFLETRLFSDTVTVPPQTPNDSSPDKIQLSMFDTATMGPICLEQLPDLPTPCTDETAGPENDMHDRFSSFSSRVTSALSDTTTCLESAVTTKSSKTSIDRYEYSPNLRCNYQKQRHGSVTAETAIEQNGASSRDPRRQRQNQVSDLSYLAGVSKDSLAVASNVEISDTQINTEKPNEMRPTSSDDNARPSVKRCQKCQKQVFGTDFCRVCSSDKDISGTDKLTNLQRDSSVVVLTIDEDMSENKVSSSSDTAPRPHKEALQVNVPKNPLKRSANNSNLFLKNKRPKSSILFSSSGSTRPDYFKRKNLEKRPLVNIPRPEIRREPFVSLSDLLMEERAKNSRRRSSLVLETSPMQSPASDLEKEIEPPNLPQEQTSMRSTALVQIPAKDRVVCGKPLEESYATSDTGLFSSPQQIPRKRQHSPVRLLTETNDDMSQRAQIPVASRSPQHPSHEARRWQDLASPESQTCSVETTRMSPKRSHFESPSPSLAQSETSKSSDELRDTTKRRQQLSRDIVISPEKFSWASAITCRQCQKNHKKCLHDNDGRLSAIKCRDYVLSRKGRPDTGRSRHEWNAILEASELDPDSDEGSSQEGSDSEIASGSSSESEDDFATAVAGDDHVILDNDNADSRNLLEKFQKPRLAELASPKLRSPTAVAKFFVTEKDDDVAIAKIPVSKTRIGGIMFESESEDDDYLSDEEMAPMRMDRPLDPLWMPLKESRNPYEVAPELDHQTILKKMQAQTNRQPRPSRKQQWAELRDRQLQERREKFGNPHWQVDRKHAKIMTTALVERIVPPKNAVIDKLAFESVEIKEEAITFCDFLGMPKLPEICLMNDGERLGFRDDQRERDRVFGRTGRGLGRRDNDDEKWPVRTK